MHSHDLYLINTCSRDFSLLYFSFYRIIFGQHASVVAQKFCNDDDCDCTNGCCCPGYVPNGDDYTQNPFFIIVAAVGDLSIESYGKLQESISKTKMNLYAGDSCKAKIAFFASDLSSSSVIKASEEGSQFSVIPYVNSGKKVAPNASSENWVQLINETNAKFVSFMKKEDKDKDTIWKVFRSPSYSWNNNLYDALYKVRTKKLFDDPKTKVSLPLTIDFSYKTKRPLYPFLLDDLTELCSNDSSILNGATPICPGRYKGQWILPSNAMFSAMGSDCYTLTECRNKIREENAGETLIELLYRNFNFRSQEQTHQPFNGFWQSRQPMTIVIEEDYFNIANGNASDDLRKFFAYIASKNFAYFVQPSMVVEWMMNQHTIQDFQRLYYGLNWLEKDCFTSGGKKELHAVFGALISWVLLSALIVIYFCWNRHSEGDDEGKTAWADCLELSKPRTSLRPILVWSLLFIPAACVSRTELKGKEKGKKCLLVLTLLFLAAIQFAALAVPFWETIANSYKNYNDDDIKHSHMKEHPNEYYANILMGMIFGALIVQFIISGVFFHFCFAPCLEELKNSIEFNNKRFSEIKQNKFFQVLMIIFVLTVNGVMAASVATVAFSNNENLQVGWIYGDFNSESARVLYGFVAYIFMISSFSIYVFILIEFATSALKSRERDSSVLELLLQKRNGSGTNGEDQKKEMKKKMKMAYKKYVTGWRMLILLLFHILLNYAIFVVFSLYALSDIGFLGIGRRAQLFMVYGSIGIINTLLFLVYVSLNSLFKIEDNDKKTADEENLENPEKNMILKFFLKTLPLLALHIALPVVLLTIPGLEKLLQPNNSG